MDDKLHYIKLDEDDILEILIEYYQGKFENCDFATAVLLGSPGIDLRFICAFSNSAVAPMHNVDLSEIDNNLAYNGDHSFLKNNPEFYITADGDGSVVSG